MSEHKNPWITDVTQRIKSIGMFVKKYHIQIEVLVGAFVIFFGLYQVYDISNNMKLTAKLETYKILQGLVNSSNIAKYRSNVSLNDNETIEFDMHLSLELVDLLDEINTCVDVGACDIDAVRRYLCNNLNLNAILGDLINEMRIWDGNSPTIVAKLLKGEVPEDSDINKTFLNSLYAYFYSSNLLGNKHMKEFDGISVQCLPYRNFYMSRYERGQIFKDDKESKEMSKELIKLQKEILKKSRHNAQKKSSAQ